MPGKNDTIESTGGGSGYGIVLPGLSHPAMIASKVKRIQCTQITELEIRLSMIYVTVIEIYKSNSGFTAPSRMLYEVL
jgi:hypothetical protein